MAIFNIFIATWYKQKQRKKEKETTVILDMTKTLLHWSNQSLGLICQRRVGILIDTQVTANNTAKRHGIISVSCEQVSSVIF